MRANGFKLPVPPAPIRSRSKSPALPPYSAMASGAQSEAIARSLGVIKALLFLALIELLVWLSVPAMVLLSQREMAVEVVAVPEAPAAKPMPQIAKPTASGTRSYYLQRLERDHAAIARRVHGGELSVYRAAIEAGIRKAPAKSQRTKINPYLPPVREDT